MRKAVLCVGLVALAFLSWAKGPIHLAIIWHQHQPLYWNRLTGEYELPGYGFTPFRNTSIRPKSSWSSQESR